MSIAPAPVKAPIRRVPAAARVAETIREQIRDGILAEGQQLMTERELAKETGVCAATVQKALKELEREGLIQGWRGRGRFVTQGRSTKTWTIGVLLYDSAHLGHPVMAQRLSGIQPTLEAAGYHVHYLAMNRRQTPGAGAGALPGGAGQEQGWFEAIDTTRYDGMIVLAHQMRPIEVHALAERLPVIWMDQHCVGPRLMGVRADLIGGAHLAAEHLAGLGHRHVALLNAGRYGNTSQEQHEGLHLYARHRDDFRLQWLNVENTRDNDDAIREALTAAFSAEDRPTALVCGAHDYVPLVIDHLADMGLSIPGDISLVSWNDVLHPPKVPVALTSVVIDLADVGRQASEVLCKLLEGEAVQPASLESKVLPARLIVRDSTGPAPAAA